MSERSERINQHGMPPRRALPGESEARATSERIMSQRASRMPEPSVSEAQA